ncbi:hypothetical protein [Nannocystis sp.]|uniref:hypothetical protein n=1 Tax=Nannocystis sp. TaxID=1962667 RepID=UPI002427C1F5|nr:hypothetical protein [Nannocystis sp.]MBK7826974.1 hypothetical protein [Nannocystis sp.]MBK9756003.1 hypothetical protein [Nannocystis sp.]
MNLRNISYMLAALLPLSACGDDKSESTGGASTGAATEAGSDTSDSGTTAQTNPTSSPTEGGSNSDSNSGTTTAPGETSDATTADATTADATTTGVTTIPPDTTTDTTTGGGGGIPEACAEACTTLGKCDPNAPPPGECTASCIEDTTPAPDAPQECVDATLAFINCIAGGTCDDLNNPDFCAKELAAQDMLCGGGGACEPTGGAGMGMCSLGETCPDYKHEIVCGKQGCRCFEDDVNVKMCPAMDICAQGQDVLQAFSLECCGW